MQQRVDIEQLSPGMYVMEVTKQSGDIKVSSKGWVKTQVAIDALKKKGVQEVVIDPDKTLFAAEEEADEPIEETQIQAKPVSMERELGKAAKLYNEAQQLQQKAFEDIKAGKPIDIEPVKAVTKGLIDSIFRNQDALLCMTRIREKDAYLLEHSLNVSILMSMFAKHLELDSETTEQLAVGAFLHDIGKILIPDAILNKKGALNPHEFEVMKSHVEHSIEILQKTSGVSALSLEVAAQHHEKLSGKGYPNGLNDEQISQAGRMIAIVDIYDALTAERVYKKGMTPSSAFKLMMTMAKQDIDHQLLQQFIKSIGVHPVGTLVKLSSGKLGIVIKSNNEQPLKPVVKLFYHAKYDHYTDIKDIDLAKPHCNEVIETSVKPEQFKIELNKFMREALLN
ncbi:HD-GYP domain-containing protein [Catenovulum sp. SM1970]|uniref:HD-GYP domain-containing protein n=1 Tax=Marinifaba aquimaris TaxID=2741323 RepID=UPI0015732BAD|nr:HD-GYP domain-containing protein [Marinifaba aquimaris]NTS78611.1 HD-GYP domain-containing protein [Marinifaba aquimaris]